MKNKRVEVTKLGGWSPISLVLDSGSEDSRLGCRLSIYTGPFKRHISVRLPAVIKPYRKWVDTSKYEWSKNPNGGYWESFSREYGFQISSEGFVQVFYGPQTHDSTTTKVWCTHLPWTQIRLVRRSYYDTLGNLWWTSGIPSKTDLDYYEQLHRIEDKVPKVVFQFKDYDGERIEVTTFIEQRDYEKGIGWFKWLSWFVPTENYRSLSMKFSKEVGPEKGSWKGGTMGGSIRLKAGELHYSGFSRYCQENRLTLMQ